jgi:hypothetical protein
VACAAASHLTFLCRGASLAFAHRVAHRGVMLDTCVHPFAMSASSARSSSSHAWLMMGSIFGGAIVGRWRVMWPLKGHDADAIGGSRPGFLVSPLRVVLRRAAEPVEGDDTGPANRTALVCSTLQARHPAVRR